MGLWTKLRSLLLRDRTPQPLTHHRCHECGCREGELHERGCDAERCPFCGNQLISCGCCYIHLGYDLGRHQTARRRWRRHPEVPMAYARMSNKSDVYVYAGGEKGKYICCTCRLAPPERVTFYGRRCDRFVDWTCETAKQMLKHLKEHRRQGHLVPKRCRKRLKEDAKMERQH